MSHPLVHQKICLHYKQLRQWYAQKTKQFSFPIYSSYDIRDAGYKLGIVDANIFPAGFNNICPVDLEEGPKLFKNYLVKHYDPVPQRILLVTEEHTHNAHYWDNVSTLQQQLEEAGCKVLVSMAQKMSVPLELESAGGKKVRVHSAYFDNPIVQEFKPELIVSNNDFSEAKEEWAKSVTLPINPPRELGWYQRKKSNFFKFYNQLVQEFCQIADIDPFLLQVQSEQFTDFDIADDASVERVAARVDLMIASLKEEYAKRNIAQTPFIYVKNNSGTYGLGVIKVNSGEDFKSLNYKSRKKMKAAKGGRSVEEVVIQEGIPSIIKADDGSTAEPVIYMVGCQLAGGFFRTHREKSESESLNSPGAVYKRMCIADLALRLTECPLENVYGWVSKLALLAIGHEAKELQVNFKDYKVVSCIDDSDFFQESTSF